ncbi:MAG: CoA-disulfide reductase [Clostridiales bacterium]|nr:CoA-disulfide reductase [Clostridiales bacterium]
MKVLIIGGVAGGATAAARIRRLDEEAEIVVIEKSGFISYANCGLPYYVGGVIDSDESLLLQSPEGFYERYRIDARVNSEAVEIDTFNKQVKIKNLLTNEIYFESYDKLLLSTGAKPVTPEWAGKSDKVFTLRTVEDALSIRSCIEEERPQSAVIVGGGFIGLEMAENLVHRGVDTTVVEYAEHLLANFDLDMACVVHGALKKKGVKLRLNSKVEKISERQGRPEVFISGAEAVCADIVILSIGVAPDTTLSKSAGIELSDKGAIVVNERMETSKKDVYAVGDSVLIKHFVTGKPAYVPLAGPANRQARVAADNICGLSSQYKGAQGTSVVKLFDMTAASTGLNEKAAKLAGINYEKIIISPPNHATYYPGARIMLIKLLYEKATQKIIGAQIAGYEGVDKRIDVLSTAMRAGMKAAELKDLDLAYAPPFSSAKDPINILGYIADNIERGLVKQAHFEDLEKLNQCEVTLLDTRTKGEYSRGTVEGFINIPVDSLRERIYELDGSKPVYVLCQSALRSYLACRILAQYGYECYNLSGGYRFYEIVKTEKAVAGAYPCGKNKD